MTRTQAGPMLAEKMWILPEAPELPAQFRIGIRRSVKLSILPTFAEFILYLVQE
jgi:hypothetical protein